MKRLFNLLPAVLLMVMLSACGEQDSAADKEPGQYGQTEQSTDYGQGGSGTGIQEASEADSEPEQQSHWQNMRQKF